MADTAVAPGHQLIPVLASELYTYGYVLRSLQKYAPDSRITRDFFQLLGRMHALSAWRAYAAGELSGLATCCGGKEAGDERAP